MNLGSQQIAYAAILWNSGNGTKTIADILKVEEHRVYNMLDSIKKRVAYNRSNTNYAIRAGKS